MPLGLYIHIPFCKKRCVYCDFTVIDISNKLNLDVFKEYVELIKRELDIYLKENVKVTTVYIGGGTPSIIGESLLKDIAEYLGKYVELDALEEFTIEANPEDVTCLFAKTVKEIGVTRVSLGIQSMIDKNLKILSRQNTREINEIAIKTLQDNGIENINCDLMFDIPGETKEELMESIEKLLDFGVPHISAYGLTIEEFTPLGVFVKKGIIKPKDNFKEEFLTIHCILEENGFNHYEVSNYAKKGYESVHNLIYWNREEYIGVGISACGFIGKKRYQNEISLRKYSEKLQKGILPVMFEEVIDPTIELEELIMLGLRKREGIEVKKLRVLLEEEKLEKLFEKVKSFQGYLLLTKEWIRPTVEGWIYLDYIVAELLSVVT